MRSLPWRRCLAAGACLLSLTAGAALANPAETATPRPRTVALSTSTDSLSRPSPAPSEPSPSGPKRAFQESPILSISRRNLEAEDDGRYIYLVDTSQGRKRVYQYRNRLVDRSSLFANKKYYLDPDGQLFLLRTGLNLGDGKSNTFACIASPLTPTSPAYESSDIVFPLMTRGDLVTMAEENVHFRDGSRPFGEATLRNLKAVPISKDVNEPEVEQRSVDRLSQEVATYLNARMLSWTDSLYELLNKGNARVFREIKLRPQDLALALEVRDMQNRGEKGDEYFRKLQRANRQILDYLLGDARGIYTFPYTLPGEHGDALQPEEMQRTYQPLIHDRLVFRVRVRDDILPILQRWMESKGTMKTQGDGKFTLVSKLDDGTSRDVFRLNLQDVSYEIPTANP